MSAPFKLGVTGGIGSGKSMICKIFNILGVPIYYADDRAKALLVEDSKLKAQIVELFGEESYKQGELNRPYLAAQVFNDPKKLEQMNALVHPAVADDFEQFLNEHKDEPLVVKEAALLFETGSYKKLDQTIAVLASKSIRLNRVLLRDPQRSVGEIEKIMEKQISDAQRRKLADHVIANNGEVLLIPQVMKIFEELTSD